MIDVERDGTAVILHQSQLSLGSKTDPVSTVWLGSFVSEVPRDFKTAVDSTISNGNIFSVCGKNNINRMCFRTRASAFLACFVSVSLLPSAAHAAPRWRFFYLFCFSASGLPPFFFPPAPKERQTERKCMIFAFYSEARFQLRECLSKGSVCFSAFEVSPLWCVFS